MLRFLKRAIEERKRRSELASLIEQYGAISYKRLWMLVMPWMEQKELGQHLTTLAELGWIDVDSVSQTITYVATAQRPLRRAADSVRSTARPAGR